jgi:hypothetical protein
LPIVNDCFCAGVFIVSSELLASDDYPSSDSSFAWCDGSAAVLGAARRKKTAKPLRTSPFLLKRFYKRTKVIRIATAWKRPSVGHGRARDH